MLCLNSMGQSREVIARAIIRQLQNEMVLVPGDTFTMGCMAAKDKNCLEEEKPPHPVKVDSFYIAKYDVTQIQWRAIMDTNPSHFRHCGDCPAENVSWDDIQKFILKLNSLSGEHYRLPTEAEWEYAARGGNQSKGYIFAGNDKLDSIAWCNGTSGDSTHPVGDRLPNELGLYDMTGNVWQWCNDWYDDKYYRISPDKNPQGPDNGQYRVVRGSSYSNLAKYNRVTLRRKLEPYHGDRHGGFRLAESVK